VYRVLNAAYYLRVSEIKPLKPNLNERKGSIHVLWNIISYSYFYFCKDLKEGRSPGPLRDHPPSGDLPIAGIQPTVVKAEAHLNII
jgi:hypothetical protein